MVGAKLRELSQGREDVEGLKIGEGEVAEDPGAVEVVEAGRTRIRPGGDEGEEGAEAAVVEQAGCPERPIQSIVPPTAKPTNFLPILPPSFPGNNCER